MSITVRKHVISAHVVGAALMIFDIFCDLLNQAIMEFGYTNLAQLDSIVLNIYNSLNVFFARWVSIMGENAM